MRRAPLERKADALPRGYGTAETATAREAARDAHGIVTDAGVVRDQPDET
jgi:hypothetical protein